MRVKPLDLAFYVDRLREGKPFSFARYGNGEWGCILGTATQTGTGSQKLNIPELGRGLINSIRFGGREKDYFLAMQSRDYLKQILLLKSIERWLQHNAPHSSWYEGEVFPKASMKSKLYPLIKQLREMKVVVVGPHYLRALSKGVFNYVKFIQVAPKNCFRNYGAIYDEVLGSPKGSVISFSAGPTTKVLIHDLYSQIGEHSFLIDFGSLWDPYCGRNTRRYHVRINKTVQKANLR